MRNPLIVCFSLPLLWLAALPVVQAQSITAAPDGTGTVIQYQGNTYQIQGGTQTGVNLFHSFQQFGLNNGEIANFLSQPSVTNIFGRVVGGDASVIDGLIQANPNLYLMNPAGIVFGANAQLNIGGDFFATTAEQICFASGCFNSVGVNDYHSLLGRPTTFGFLHNQPGGLINAGTLAVQKGKSIHLSGGTVINLGQVLAPGGIATVAAIPGQRAVRLAQPGNLLSLEVAETVLNEGIIPLDLPSLLAATPAQLQGKAIATPIGNLTQAGTVQAAQVDLYAAGQVNPAEMGSTAGATRVVRFSEQGSNPTQAVFIDERVDQPEDLLYGSEAGTVTQIIGKDEKGISVISEQLAVISESVGELESVAIAAEGNQGDFWLGDQWIHSGNIGDYATQLQTWGNALTMNADILLYSCFTALGATGEAFVASLANLTGADVAASVDATGSANYGGDWQLEHSTGAIETTTPFTATTLANWNGKLATRTVTNTNDAGARSLRDALTNNGGGFATPVAPGDAIAFNIPGSPLITLSREIAWSTNDLTIDGANIGGDNVVIDGGGNGRVFNILAHNATLENLTIRNGRITGTAQGGGIRHSGTGTLTLNHSTISGNTANRYAGGINSFGHVVLNHSTVSGNSATLYVGGIRSLNSVTLNHSTVSGNSSGRYGAGIRSFGDTVVNDSVISGNISTI
ncbi:MAG: DUF4347 domain-containing protein, partial [Spirulina sp. SIO3F2]|nr:DUF4347 domain-containing protein [Spirulina sp. SIO3F2]